MRRLKVTPVSDEPDVALVPLVAGCELAGEDGDGALATGCALEDEDDCAGAKEALDVGTSGGGVDGTSSGGVTDELGDSAAAEAFPLSIVLVLKSSLAPAVSSSSSRVR